MGNAYDDWLARHNAQAQQLQSSMSPGKLDPGPNPYADPANFQTLQSSYFKPEAPQANYGDMAGAGITAAGALAGSLANAAGNKAQIDAGSLGSQMARDAAERMTMASVRQNAAQSKESNKQHAYQDLISALTAKIQNVMSQRQLKRGISRSGADGLTTAFLG